MKAHIIVLGNEKGGSGKTTTAMHLIMSLLSLGFKVASFDLDFRQQSLTHYLENRKNTAEKESINLSVPEHMVIDDSFSEESLEQRLNDLKDYDFIVIDTPGSDSPKNRLVHTYANTVITPINDSFIDVDLIGRIDAHKLDMVKPGVYSAMVWEQKLKKASRDKQELKWFIVRNRLAALEAINKKKIDKSLDLISKRLGFEIAPGFGDRVIFKELFLHGLTLLDVNVTNKIKVNPSMLAARQELRNFLRTLGLCQDKLQVI